MSKKWIFLLLFPFQSSFSQNVGIGTTTPLARLHVLDSNVVFSASGVALGNNGPSISGQGRRMLWYPARAAFRVGYVGGSNWDRDSIGYYSFAAGHNTKALRDASVAFGYGSEANGEASVAFGTSIADGNYSFSMGISSLAKGEFSIAMGQTVRSYGYNSIAMGNNSVANGTFANAIGSHLTANAYASTVVGYYNNPVVTPETSVNLSSPVFLVGNGYNVPSNAMTVLLNGNIGIGNDAPLARLHVLDSNVVFSASGDITGNNGPSISGPGRRLLWYPAKAAFRAGYVYGNYWDKDSIGDYSFAAGYNTKASRFTSVAIGFGSEANGDASVALGSSIADGSYSFALGLSSLAKGISSIAMGQQVRSYGYNSIAMGNSTESRGAYANAIGSYLTANAYASTVVGYYNNPVVSPETTISLTSPVFLVGNGFNEPSNAMTILLNGNTGIGNDAPSQRLVVNGNILVQNNKGIIRTTDGTQKKQLTTTATVNVTLAADGTTAVNFVFPESFSSVPDVYVGNVISGAGGWAEVVMTISNVTTTGGALYIHNTRTVSWSPNFVVKIIAIGPQ